MQQQLTIRDIPAPVGQTDFEQCLWVRAEQVTIPASVGIYRDEMGCKQDITLNIAVEVHEPRADSIHQTIDYRTLVETALLIADSGHFELIETFVCQLGRELVSLSPAAAVEIELFKPRAIPPAMASVRFQIKKR